MTSLVAHASVVVATPRSSVWEALLRPDTIMKIMPVTAVLSPWSLGAPFRWTFEMLGKPHDVEGSVLRMETDRVLEYEFVDPHARALKGIENRHRVTIDLVDEAAGTRVSVAQDNMTDAALAHAAGGWRLALNNLKALVEGSS